MWTRAELKARAKECLKKYYWAAFAVSLIFGLVSGFGGGSSGGSTTTNSLTGSDSGYYSDYGFGSDFLDDFDIEVPDALYEVPEIVGMLPGSGHGSGSSSILMNRLFWGIFAGVMVVILIISLVLSIFVAPVMEVGKNRFYMESRVMGRSAGVGKLFWGFSHRYLNIVGTMLLRGIFITIGTIFCVFPGIYLSYCYYLVPYILAENPDMRPMEAMRLSKQMMEGHKFNTFVLELSFIGWYLLGLLACGIGGLFVKPYEDATYAELYAVLRGPYSGGLGGFGEPEVVNSGSWGGSYVEPDHVYDSGNGYGPQGGGSYGDGYGPQGGDSYGNGYGPQGDFYGNPYGNGSGQDDGWTQGGSRASGQEANDGSGDDRGTDVSRSEGGPGRGYYLNGVFYPYSDDEK